MKLFGYKPALALCIGALLLASSCHKEDTSVYGPAVQTQSDPTVKRKILNVVKALPKITSDRTFHRGGNGNSVQDGWDFTNPGIGFSYSTNNGLIVYSQNGNMLVLSTSALSSNQTSGGTVVAGATALDINYTYCFASDNGDQALGGNLFSSTNASTNGVSGVIGVSGDFEELQNADSTTKFGDIFHGLAFYFVYDGTPSGSYDVVDWLNVDWGDSTTFDKKCFAFIFDFQNGRLFLSSSGSINVSGGSMAYQGKYFEVSGFLDDNGNYDLSGNNLTYREVDGFGTMGCN